MRGLFFGLAAGLGLWAASPAMAYFHQVQINKVVVNAGDNPAAQAIELRFRAALMGDLQFARLMARDATGQNPIVICDFNRPMPQQFRCGTVLITSAASNTLTSPPSIPDFTMTQVIPESYFAAGTLTYESDEGAVQWRVCWGGAAYSGPTNISIANDSDGSVAPPYVMALPTLGNAVLVFKNDCPAASVSSANDYEVIAEGTVFFRNNAGGAFGLSASDIRACCMPTGGCMDLQVADCTGLGGVPSPMAGVRCEGKQGCPPVFTCPPLGGCCLPGGGCEDRTEVGCAFVGGTWSAEACALDPCAPPEACCVSGGFCLDVPPMVCSVAVGGTPQGPGTVCDGFVCSPVQTTAACCLPSGACQVLTLSACLDQGGTNWDANNPTCDGVGCPPPMLEACCFCDGACMDLPPEECAQMGGDARGPGSSCSGGIVCVPQMGACCLPGGGCQESSCVGCTQLGGTYFPGQPCSQSCALAVQACCFADGSCTETDAVDCVNDGGTPGAPGTSCMDPLPECRSACCFGDGTCQFLQFDVCFQMGGVFVSPASCESAGCEDLFAQACCLPDGQCMEATPSVCMGDLGIPQGAGTSCGSAVCTQFFFPCCLSDGSCLELTELECSGLDGVTQPGMNCAATQCPPPDPIVACCFSGQDCQLIPTSQCVQIGGVITADCAACLGPDVNCCISPGDCQSLPFNKCEGLGGVAVSDCEADCSEFSSVGDMDGDGTVGLADLAVIIQHWGAPYGLEDLAVVINNWGRLTR